MDDRVKDRLEAYSAEVTAALLNLRTLILDVGKQLELPVEETLKWGQVSYLTKTGTTIRIAGVKGNSAQYNIYFNCKTRMVETIKEVYGDVFIYEDNRALIFDVAKKLPEGELRQIIAIGLKYHHLKQQDLLGL